MVDQSLPTHCPNCGDPMIHEDAERRPDPAAGSGGSAVWMNPGSYKTARCSACGHVVDPPAETDE